MAANDYIIVAPNRRGLPGFGVEWNEAISGDYGGQCMKDYFTAIDEMSKEPFAALLADCFKRQKENRIIL